MSQMIIIECDYMDGECLKRFEGFTVNASDEAKNKILEEDYGWLVRESKHYCPIHKKQILEGE